ncbi:DNA repair protein RAD51 homolog 4 isoform X2 [Humulus lupulus]|uniref:DNA repair protein RAD51 homolog 4 isoform X2 n=1 Tax=Humulus lupulus TaxID=3486 RepID=UPI002B414C2C|nr:DNA repair protein RAD51 homolog 4 isoform X2 [Humulus lupulus]
MAPLKSLEQDHRDIDSHFQSFCALFVEDFLLNDHYVLAAMAERQPESERLKQGITELLSIIDGQHKPLLNGMELLADALHNKRVLSTGCDGIDLLLGGGLREGQLTELVGPSSSGKTQVCLQAASNVAKKHMGSVLYLDTSNSFSPQRIACFLDLAKGRFLQNVMNSILCQSVYDIFTMFGVLHQLESSMRSQRGPQMVRLIIIDSISSLITPILGGSGSHVIAGHALMVSAGYLLKKLAYEYNLAVLVTNHTVGGEGGVPKPALGETWKSISHVRLLLSHDRENNTSSVSIIKHPSLASGMASSFVICG